MTNHSFSSIDALDLSRVVGGAALDWNAIKQQAQPYCPQTVAKYSHVNPASVTRPIAQQMGNACLAEMGPLKAGFARGTVQGAIDQAFPR